MKPNKLPSPELIVADAASQASETSRTRGTCSLDRRFRWRSLQTPNSADHFACFDNLQDDNEWPELEAVSSKSTSNTPQASRQRCTLTSDQTKAVISNVHSTVLAQGRVLHRVSNALSARLQATGARAIVTGTTPIRCTLSSLKCKRTEVSAACPASSDLDIDVHAPHDQSDSLIDIRKSIDAACADLLADGEFVRLVATGARMAKLDVENSRINSCLYVPLDGSSPPKTLGVDVPRFSESSPRLTFGCVSATRNDAMGNGVVLHRLRVTGWVDTDSGRTRITVPFVDIKSYMSPSTPIVTKTVPTQYNSQRHILVPGERHLCVELSRLLSRVYDNVDASKDTRRAHQLHLLERSVRGQDGCLSQSLPPLPPLPKDDEPRARDNTTKHYNGRQHVRKLKGHSTPHAVAV